MWALVASDRFAVVPVILITVRELAIQAFRSYWVRRGLAVPATALGEGEDGRPGGRRRAAPCVPLFEDELWIADTALWLAVALTMATGVQYLHRRPPSDPHHRQLLNVRWVRGSWPP